ncbi:uncharacterized protein CMC5_044910 [Chondromyces crocatus]|uniref:Lipoprotein n=2 Tax=Chondromyces crocatus TaxID=52 RepID=A0A0K1EIB3_CHOCO|nr:uncharacterized protein CMC5_044910 [Chondromyces crocatus]
MNQFSMKWSMVIVIGLFTSSGCLVDTDPGSEGEMEDADAASEVIAEVGEEQCTPSIGGVSASSTPRLNSTITYTINGSCLPSTIAMWIGDCDGIYKQSGNASQARFSCTHRWTAGIKEVHIKDRPGGYHLYPSPFTINVFP